MGQYSRRIGGALLALATVVGALSVWPQERIEAATGANGEVFLQGDYVEVGIHNAGSFGTASPAPAGFHPKVSTSDRRLGFVVDMQKDGWANGTPPQSGDYFVPGTPEEGWSVEWTGAGGAERTFGNYGLNNSFQVPKTSLTETSSGDTRSAVWEGTASAASSTEQLKITQTIHFNKGDQFFVISTVMTNVGTATLNSLEFMRNVDPDQEQPITGNFTTSNYVVNDGDKKLVVAKGLNYGITLGLGTIDARAVVSTEGFANRDPDAILNSPVAPAKTSPIVADQAIALAYRFGSLAPGQSVSFDYAYILNEADLDTALSNLGAIDILQPSGTVSGSGVLYQATTNDVSNTTYVEFFINGASVGIDYSPDAGGVFSTTLDSTRYPNGTINLKVVATFADGKVAEKSSTASVDNSGPPMTFSTPTAGQGFQSGVTIPIAIDVLDPSHPPARVSFFRESASSGSLFLGQSTTQPFTSSFTVTGLPPGETVTIKAVGTDTLNRTTTMQVSGTANLPTQAITFDPLPGRTYGDANFTVAATASSGLAVSFMAAGDCTILPGGNTVHLTGSGSCTITARQGGNASYSAAPDVAQSFSIGKATLTLTANNAMRVYRAPDPALTASYSGFVNGDSLATSVTGAPSIATAAVATSPVGSYLITPALGSLSSANYGFAFGAGTLSVLPALTSTSVATSASPSTFGQPVTFTASVAVLAPGSGAPTGVVTFTDGATTLGTAMVTDAQATFTPAALSVGPHVISATYGGDPNFVPSTSGPLAQTVNRAETSVGATASANPSVVGQTVTFTATVHLPFTPAPAPVGHWRLDDPAGSTGAVDSAGTGDATCGTQCPAFGAAGLFGTAATFNGSIQSLRVRNVIAGTFSASAWIKTTQTGGTGDGNAYSGHGIIWSDVGGAANDMVPMALVGSRLAFGTGESGGSGYNTITSTSPVNTGTWVHVVVTRNGTTGAKQLYINGALEATGAGGAGALNANSIVAVGANPLDNRYFNGAIDDVQFFDHVLTAAEVQGLFTGLPGAGGTVSFSDNGTTLHTSPVVNGAAVFATSTLALGDHSITATYSGDGNYEGGDARLTQTVNRANTTTVVTSSNGSPSYGNSVTFTARVAAVPPAGGMPAGTVTFLDGETPLGTVALSGGVAALATSSLEAGSHAITAIYDGGADCNGSQGGVTQAVSPRAVTVTADPESKVYGDADPALTYRITGGSLVGGDALTGSLTRAAGEDVGSYAIQQGTLALSGNYTLTYVGEQLAITVRGVTVAADAKSKTYGDADPALTYQVTAGSLAFSDAFTGALARAAGENVGPYSIERGTLALSSNYALTFVGADLAITARPVTVAADAKSKTYGDADPALTYRIASGSLAFADAFTGALARVPGENVGSYAIQHGTLALSSNYELVYAGADLTLGARRVTITADAKSKTYGDADPAFTYQITGGSLAFADTFSGSLTRAAGENVGTYALQQGTLALSSNYELVYAGAGLTIGARPVTMAADAKSKTYGDADPALTYQITSGSLAFGDTFSGSLTRAAGENVGTYALQQGTLALSSNYELVYAGAGLTIGARPVTMAADAKSKTYGDADPALTYQITSGSLAFGDTFSGSLTRVAGEHVGTYAIQQGTLALSANYALTYVGASLAIAARPISVTADSKTMIFAAADPTLTYRITSGSLAFSDAFGGALTRAAGQNVGTYAIQQGTLALSGNYVLTFVPGTLTITYDTCVLYNPAKAVKSGATIPLKLQVCSATGVNQSAPNTVVQAQQLWLSSTATYGTIADAGNANPDNDFRYDVSLGPGYIFNLKTTGLASGTYSLSVSVTGDPKTHVIEFQVK